MFYNYDLRVLPSFKNCYQMVFKECSYCFRASEHCCFFSFAIIEICLIAKKVWSEFNKATSSVLPKLFFLMDNVLKVFQEFPVEFHRKENGFQNIYFLLFLILKWNLFSYLLGFEISFINSSWVKVWVRPSTILNLKVFQFAKG